ncbi:hypothetical protein WM41_2564 [Corynebacterium simulans]|uniref:Uncharacterized protein n=1 Tax=Corynebacterium simulans TaxID=146827 RepID=A0ABR5V5T1_9CORY|nr:hypothetical protein WM41_2564 [Corynebacterium simulans]
MIFSGGAMDLAEMGLASNVAYFIFVRIRADRNNTDGGRGQGGHGYCG